ncbi:MAG: hypothetical protein JWM12_1766 [Ilumatobacteraceae bacterium]|nr:hypothetical protein [Ilumatobacteraceae bacterium]
MGIIAGASRGAAAGVLATAAMDLLWYRRYRDGGGEASFTRWELSTDAHDFGADAPAPARVGKRIADAVGIDLDDSLVAPTNNVVHWMTGVGWGMVAGIAASVLPAPTLGVGVGTGATAWGTSYAVLGRLGIYKAITEYDEATLWKDLSAHLVFGLTLGVALGAAKVLRRR